MVNRQQKQQQKVFKRRQKARARRQAQSTGRQPRRESTSAYYMCPFDELFPEQAAQEYGTLRVVQQDDAVVDDYTVIEYLCSNPACDCQKMLLDVVAHSTHTSMALIEVDLRRFSTAHLSDDKPQSPFAPTLLALLTRDKLSDEVYQTHLKAHYRQLKQATRNPTPAQATVLRGFRDK